MLMLSLLQSQLLLLPRAVQTFFVQQTILLSLRSGVLGVLLHSTIVRLPRITIRLRGRLLIVRQTLQGLDFSPTLDGVQPAFLPITFQRQVLIPRESTARRTGVCTRLLHIAQPTAFVTVPLRV